MCLTDSWCRGHAVELNQRVKLLLRIRKLQEILMLEVKHGQNASIFHHNEEKKKKLEFY